MRDPLRLLLSVGWGLVATGAVILAVRYPDLPSSVPVYRSLGGAATEVHEKSALIVGRIALLGFIQALMTTLMALSSTPAPGWRRFWGWATLAAGIKTLSECLSYAQPDPAVERLLLGATPCVVLLFLVYALHAWRSGHLRGALRLPQIAKVGIAASIVAWAIVAALPKLL